MSFVREVGMVYAYEILSELFIACLIKASCILASVYR